jgi:hypothetical protein
VNHNRPLESSCSANVLMEKDSMKKLRRAATGFAAIAMSIGSCQIATAQSTCSPTNVTPLDSGAYNFQMNEWNSTAKECVSINGVGFTITTANFDLPTNGAPATYTSIYRGCHWGTCTSSNPFPIQEGNIASATTSVNTTQLLGYNNDAAFDIWFNQTSTTSGQPNGTELMIWLNHGGSVQPFGSQVGTTTINGAQYEVWTGNQSSWKIVSYVATAPVAAVANLNLLPFFSDAVSRGSLKQSWWLIDVEYGFEIWTGGQGLAMSGFKVSAAAKTTSGGSCTSVPSAPSGVRGTAASSSVINVSWTADTAPPNCSINSYIVYRSTTSGFAPSSSNQIASGVTSTSFSDGGRQPSTTYYYVVKAVDTAGTSAASAQGSATTAAVPSGSGTGCHVSYTITNQWQGGFQAAVTIENTGSTALQNWSLTWSFANGQTITNLWNGSKTQSGSNVIVRNLSYNGAIASGGSYSGMGFTGTWNNSANAVPAAFAVNGTTCH